MRHDSEMASKRRRTFAEIVDEVQATPRPELEVLPGTFNRLGQFFDPSGAVLTRHEQVSPSEAADLVARGATVVIETCGCGGGHGCTPRWIDTDGLDRLRTADKPRFVKGYGSPTWIDHWTVSTGDVVFLHGDVKWGDVV